MRSIACDIDGVLANFSDSYASLLHKETGIVFPKCSDTWPVDWFWERKMGVTSKQEKSVWDGSILSSKSFWRNLDALDGSTPAIYRLNNMAQQGDQIFFITNRPGLCSKYQTERWLYDLGMSYPTVLVAADKLPLLKALKIDFFIDDRPETIQEVGLDASVPHLYLKDAPYNRTQVYAPTVKRAASLLVALDDCYGPI